MSSAWRCRTIQYFLDKGEAELKTGPFGTQLRASDYVQSGTPVINVRNIGFGVIRDAELEFIAMETVQRLASHLLEPGDIVFGRKGAVERHALIKKAQSQWFQGSDCLRLRWRSPSVDPQFVSYCFLTEDHKQWMINHCSHGSTMASLNQTIISQIPLRIPPLATQRRIAAVLSAYDDLIENNQRRIAILEDMARNLYREWFVEFRFPGWEKARFVETALGRVPAGWEVVKVDEISRIYRGRSYKSSELVEDGGLPFLNLKCVDRGGGFRRDGIKRYQGSFKATQVAQKGDIIIAVTDMTQERRLVAHAARVPDIGESQAVISMDLVKIEPMPEIPNAYLYAFLRYSNFPNEVKQYANGANVLHLSPERIGEYTFSLPIEAIRRQFSSLIDLFLDLSDNLHLKNTDLRRQRDLLLPRLVSGELDVSELELAGVEE